MAERVDAESVHQAASARFGLTPTKVFVGEGNVDGFALRLELGMAWRETARLWVNGVMVAESGYLGIYRPHLDAEVATPDGIASVRATVSRGGLYRNLRAADTWCTVTWNGKPVSLRVTRAPWLSAQPRSVRRVYFASALALAGAFAFFLPAKSAGSSVALAVVLPLLLGRIPRDIR